jgi:hypothetical protein
MQIEPASEHAVKIIDLKMCFYIHFQNLVGQHN